VFVGGRRVLIGEFAMFLGRRGVLLRLVMVAELMVMSRLMMVMRGGVVVRGGGLVMLARRMLGRFRHDFVLLPESGQSRLSLRDDQ
jgi:uncharacterized membrane protein YedE/YeeE